MLLSGYIEFQHEQREAIAGEWPEDSRYRKGAEALASLAEYIKQVETEGPGGDDWGLLERIRPHLFDELMLGGERAAREASRYGFHHVVNEATHAEFLGDLWIACMEDAYDEAKEFSGSVDESNSTGELFPCEVHAAWHGVKLPRDYWERRPRTFESELEAQLEPLIAAVATADEMVE